MKRIRLYVMEIHDILPTFLIQSRKNVSLCTQNVSTTPHPQASPGISISIKDIKLLFGKKY